MAITKASILITLNQATRFAETDIDSEIIWCLRDLSKLHVLRDEDTTVALTSSSLYISYPTDSLSDQQAVESLVLTDASGNREFPVLPLPGGWREYNMQMESFSDSARSIPRYYVCHDRKIYLWPAPNGVYTGVLCYFKFHPDTADTIEFTEEWQDAIEAGTIYRAALLRKHIEHAGLWGGIYQQQKNQMAALTDDGPHIIATINS